MTAPELLEHKGSLLSLCLGYMVGIREGFSEEVMSWISELDLEDEVEIFLTEES